MFVSSTPNQFDASCIESLNGLPVTQAPTASPVVPGYPVFSLLLTVMLAKVY
jgi:hypothetical protein